MAFRQAKGVDGVERDWTPRENYMLYSRGFGDGACHRSMRVEGHPAYDAGYADGEAARSAAVTAYVAKIGYKPSLFRTAVGDEPEETP